MCSWTGLVEGCNLGEGEGERGRGILHFIIIIIINNDITII